MPLSYPASSFLCFWDVLRRQGRIFITPSQLLLEKQRAQTRFPCYIELVKRQLQFRLSLRLLSRSRLSY